MEGSPAEEEPGKATVARDPPTLVSRKWRGPRACPGKEAGKGLSRPAYL